MGDHAYTPRTFRIGPIRPPSEADSLLLQVTNGCTWNRCKFCQLYRHTKFKMYTVESVCRDIDAIAALVEETESFRAAEGWDIAGLNRRLGELSQEERICFSMVANWYIHGGGKVFLQDGNSVALSGGKLSTVLSYLRKRLPFVTRVTSYGRAQNLSKVSAEDFRELHEAGLDCIHSGYESGSDAVLSFVNKGVTQEQQITAGKAIRAGGIELSVYFMPGLGGHELSKENAIGMTEVVNACGPDVVRIRTAAVKEGTEWMEDLRNGRFTLASEDEKVLEIRYLIEHADFDGRIVSDHMINLLQEIEGHARRDKAAMLETIDAYLSMSEEEKRLYQLARRMVWVQSPGQMKLLSDGRRRRLADTMREFLRETDAAEASASVDGKDWDDVRQARWNERMNALISRYI